VGRLECGEVPLPLDKSRERYLRCARESKETGLLKRGIIVLVFLSAFVSLVGRCSAETIHVPVDFSTIEEAIRASAPGDTVLVGPGVYSAPIPIEGRPSIALVADGPVVIEADADRDGIVVVGSDAVTVSGFYVSGGRCGISVEASSRVSVTGNTVDGSLSGIRIHGGDRNSVTANVIALAEASAQMGEAVPVQVEASTNAHIDENRVLDSSGDRAVGSGL
jgi:parallel beta-helix repeat protein